MTITEKEMTPGQRRTAAARATRARQADDKAADRLRAAGYVVVSGAAIRAMAQSIASSDQGTPEQRTFVRAFGEGLKAVVEVSDTIRAARE